MKQSVKESIVPLTAFRRKSDEILKRAHETGSPIVLTQNGYAAAVLLPPELYDELVESANKAHKAEVAAAIERGRKAASQGKVRDHDSLMDELDQWLRE